MHQLFGLQAVGYKGETEYVCMLYYSWILQADVVGVKRCPTFDPALNMTMCSCKASQV